MTDAERLARLERIIVGLASFQFRRVDGKLRERMKFGGIYQWPELEALWDEVSAANDASVTRP